MIFSLTLITVLAAHGQVAFYNAGTVTVEGTGLLYVDGDVEIASTGSVTNDGTIEIKGNMQLDRADGTINSGSTGERVVKFTGTTGPQVLTSTNISTTSITIHKIEASNSQLLALGGGLFARGLIVEKDLNITGGIDFQNSGAIFMDVNDLTIGLNASLTNYSATQNIRFTPGGELVKKIATGQPSTVHQFPYQLVGFGTGEGTYLPGTIRLNTAPAQADEIRFSFAPESNIGNIFHVGNCTNIGPGGNQNIMLNKMVEDFGYWVVDAEDAAGNNLDNTNGWNYDITLYPTAAALNNLQATYGSDYFKILRKPSHSGNTPLAAPNSSTDWSNFVTESGTYCNGIVEIASYNANVGITATQVSKFSNFGGAGNEGGASLPIELLSLEAVPVDNQYIAVKWATSIEIDNKGFEVLRSTNGEDFTVQGWVDGNGSSTTLRNYNFIDRNVVPNQLYYYRLRQVDNNENSELTHIVTAQITGSSIFVVSDFIPNPSHSATRIEITSSDVKEVNVTIYNTLGQIISAQNVNLNIGTTPINFDMSEVAAGTYYGVITVGEEVYNKKVVIARQ